MFSLLDALEQFSIERLKTKTKPITYQLQNSANLNSSKTKTKTKTKVIAWLILTFSWKLL